MKINRNKNVENRTKKCKKRLRMHISLFQLTLKIIYPHYKNNPSHNSNKSMQMT